MNTNYSQLLEMYKTMIKIRLVETKVMKLFEQSEMPGFIHSYIGEEAVASGICFNLNQKDMITSLEIEYPINGNIKEIFFR